MHGRSPMRSRSWHRAGPGFVIVRAHHVAAIDAAGTTGQIQGIDGGLGQTGGGIFQAATNHAAGAGDNVGKWCATGIRTQATFRLKAVGKIALVAAQDFVFLDVDRSPHIPVISVQITPTTE